MSYRPRLVHVVSHTHWDREWYRTFHSFRVYLVRVVRQILDRLENDPDFEHFLLDGQAIVLEDYLEVHPEDGDRIRRLVERGALSLGPWYMLPDEFLIGAEPTVRNLVYGHKVAAAYGGAQKAGYMPDSFGHIAQVPQILRQAGIDSFVYTRGNGAEIDETGHEFFWEAPDGSSVLAINQCGGYCNAGGLGFEEIWHAHTRRTLRPERAVEQVTELFDKMGERSQGDVVLLNNGCDHFPPQQDFGRVLGALREAFPETEFRHTDLSAFLDSVREADFVKHRFRGELVSGRLHHILSGVWSARMPLKQRNEEAQSLLAYAWEPLQAYTHFAHGRPYPSGLVEYAWKLLLQNHPHDSICGCSTDEVHRDMLPRFDGVVQTAEQSIADELENLAPTFARDAKDDGETVLCVMNTLPFQRDEVVDRLVVLQPFGVDPSQLSLVDERGNGVPFRIVERWTVERFWGVDYRTMLRFEDQDALFAGYRRDFAERILKSDDEADVHDTFLHIQFLARDLPALGHANYRLTTRSTEPTEPATPESATVSGNVLENPFCRVTVRSNGTFDLVDKQTDREYRGLNVLEDTEDIGDEYDYSPCAHTATVTSDGAEGELRVVEDTGMAAAVEVRFGLSLPAAIEPDRSRRSGERVDCPCRVRVRVTSGSPLVEIEVEIENRAQDHRLRAHFPSLVTTDEIVSDGHYYTNVRPVERPSGDDWCQPTPPTVPQQDFSLLTDGKAGLVVFNRGLPETEAVRGDDGRTGLALTLLRSVGWLSRDDFPTRRCQNAGPTIATPEAQCLGPQRFRYAVAAFDGDWVEAGVKDHSQAYRAPPLVVQGVEDLEVPGGASFLETTSGRTSITAVKRHEAHDTLVVRFYNLTGEPVTETLLLGRDVARAWRVNLLEEREDALTPGGSRTLAVEAGPHRIVTLEIAFAEARDAE